MNHKKMKTRAKINLTLDVLGKRKDNYHEVEMIMQSIDLFDEMEFISKKKGITIYCQHCEVPIDESNIVYRAAKLLKDEYNIDKGIDIFIHKNIPVAAGLAGGSSNGAGTLQALNELWQLDLPLTKLMELGKRVGADIPFCLLGGTALAQGIGEKLQSLPPLPSNWLVLVKPPISISTAWVYKNLKINRHTQHPDTARAIQGIKEQNIDKAIPYFYNILEDVTIPAYPEIKAIKKRLEELGAKGVLMSGSGPTVFGFCRDEKEAQSICRTLKKEYNEVFIAKTYDEEVEAEDE